MTSSGITDATRVRLIQRSDGPVYLVGNGSSVIALHADDLSAARVSMPELARAMASDHARQRGLSPGGADAAQLVERDQWTVAGDLNRHPPLYRLAHGGKTFYARDDKHKDELLKREFHANAKVEVSRFKGLGEMDWQELGETTMAPATRTLLRVSVEDAAIADEMFSTLMGDDVETRRRFIQDNAKDVRFIDA